jgi:hypothetical protein
VKYASETCKIQTDIDLKWDEAKVITEVLAGSEEILRYPFLLSRGCEKLPMLQFNVSVPTAYIDSVSGKQYFQELNAIHLEMENQPER